jgi:UDP-glucose 4-epimerase
MEQLGLRVYEKQSKKTLKKNKSQNSDAGFKLTSDFPINTEPVTTVKEKSILVTGGAGFIGSHLVDELLKRGHIVTVLDNLSSGVEENLSYHNHLKFVKGDISDMPLVDKLVEASDLIFHLAEFIPSTKNFGIGHVIKFSTESPIQDFDVSARGTLIVLNSAKKYTKKFVFTSTAAVYGESACLLKETSQPLPISPYGASKLCAEQYVKLYHRLYGLPTSIVRFFNVYGPRQLKYVMYDLSMRLQKNPDHLEMFGTGEEKRDFVYVADAVKALLLVAQDEFATGEIYNVGTGKHTRIIELVNLMLPFHNSKPEIVFKGSSWTGDVKHLIGDISKISSIGYTPEYQLTDGLQRFTAWFATSNQGRENR